VKNNVAQIFEMFCVLQHWLLSRGFFGYRISCERQRLHDVSLAMQQLHALQRQQDEDRQQRNATHDSAIASLQQQLQQQQQDAAAAAALASSEAASLQAQVAALQQRACSTAHEVVRNRCSRSSPRCNAHMTLCCRTRYLLR
jgi:hypothetical protein